MWLASSTYTFKYFVILFSIKPSSGIEVNPKFIHILLLWLNFCYICDSEIFEETAFFEGKVYYHVVTFTF